MNTQNKDKKTDGWPRRLWRLVRLVFIIALIVFHHAWFNLPPRNWLLAGVDGIVLFVVAHGITRFSVSLPNAQDQP